jgi:hypothetical protein
MLRRINYLIGRRSHATGLLSAAVLVAVTGCGGGSSTNGVASKSAADILTASEAAARSATSVHVTGKAGRGGVSTIKLDLSPAAGTAQVALGRHTNFEIVRIGQTIYLKSSQLVYRQLGIGGTVPAGTWVRVAGASGPVARLAQLTEPGPELERLIRGSGRVTKGPVTTVAGQKAIELREQTPIYAGSLYVSTVGKPYPLEKVIRGQANGQNSFSAWNAPLSVTAPTPAIDASQLQHTGH